MIDFLYFLLSAVGLTLILTHGSIFDPVKSWLTNKGLGILTDASNCAQCVGFWSGMLAGFFLDPSCTLSTLPVRVFAYGCAGSVSAMFAVRHLFKPT